MRAGTDQSVHVIMKFFDDPSPEVRSAAAVGLGELEPECSAQFLSDVLNGSSRERRKKVASAVVDSGLAAKAIDDLIHEDRHHVYNALCLLSLIVENGEVQPLVSAIEEHPRTEVRGAALKLLLLSGNPEIADSAVRRRLRI